AAGSGRSIAPADTLATSGQIVAFDRETPVNAMPAGYFPMRSIGNLTRGGRTISAIARGREPRRAANGAIDRNRKRRWLVRLMTFSVAVILLIAASLVIFWPGRHAAPGRALAIAQAQVSADPFGGAAGAGPATPEEPSLQE